MMIITGQKVAIGLVAHAAQTLRGLVQPCNLLAPFDGLHLAKDFSRRLAVDILRFIFASDALLTCILDFWPGWRSQFYLNGNWLNCCFIMINWFSCIMMILFVRISERSFVIKLRLLL